jgi:hypothetical protein
MLTENGIYSNGVHTPAVSLPPKSDWGQQWPQFTHNVGWLDTDGKQHSLTIRTDDLDELLATLTTVKNVIRASKAKAAASSQVPAPDSDVPPCPVHGTPMIRKQSKRTGGIYFSHKMADGQLCFGRPAKA